MGIAIFFIGIMVLLLWGIKKNKNKTESKLSIFEHPSTFEKPGIEMVMRNGEEDGNR